MKLLNKTFIPLIGIFILLFTINTYATEISSEETTVETVQSDIIFYENSNDPPLIEADAAILADGDTGRILYSKNAQKKIYPASITKLLTALVASDYIKEDDVIVIGNEVTLVPWDSSKSGHTVGESISGINLFRGLLLPSGNDTSNVVALNVARLHTNNENISFDEAETVFAELMNEKAKKIGAVNSHFVSPHGYHDDDHYSTAEDLLKISMAALENETIKKIVGEYSYVGNGAGDQRTVDMVTQEYEWINTNRLLGGTYYYRYATGLKTGFTSQAGRCLAASATKEDENLIAIVLGCEDNQQFTESKKLLEFGFENYSIEVLQEANAVRKEIFINNPRLGDSSILQLLNTESVSQLLSPDEFTNIKSELTVNQEYITNKLTDDGDITLINEIEKDTIIAKVNYSLNGNIIYEGNLVAANDVLPRSIGSDLRFYFEKIKAVMFSWLAIPILIFVAMISIFTIRLVNQIKRRNKKKTRNLYGKEKYKFKDKY